MRFLARLSIAWLTWANWCPPEFGFLLFKGSIFVVRPVIERKKYSAPLIKSILVWRVRSWLYNWLVTVGLDSWVCYLELLFLQLWAGMTNDATGAARYTIIRIQYHRQYLKSVVLHSDKWVIGSDVQYGLIYLLSGKQNLAICAATQRNGRN